MTTALVIGCAGQDGAIITEQLTIGGARVVGLSRQAVVTPAGERRPPICLDDRAGMRTLLEEFSPDEIYYLAAHHRSSENTGGGDTDNLTPSFDAHVSGLVAILSAMVTVRPAARLFYAGSSHVFGDPPSSPQDEETPFAPLSAYGISKAAGIQVCRLYRREHGLFASTGVLYNHESPFRPPQFVSSRVVRGAVAIALGRADRLILGRLDATTDWGWAGDTVSAMRAILRLSAPDDFVVGTGEAHSVREFAAEAFRAVDLDAEGHLVEAPGIIRADGPTSILLANPRKLMRATGWRPGMSFADMVAALVRAELAKEGQ